ncbi:stearoyl-CoA 9-desaturase [Podospora pseudocomata]|uniref:Acyl-CoA desaturase n=1 Tax=Podospora pseudocomata TaxID=2093779 RepID=A0ABR0GK25_9PEZI|nr:stearoyl-CoA 9-desaturase [Podospora pseudocomata]
MSVTVTEEPATMLAWEKNPLALPLPKVEKPAETLWQRIKWESMIVLTVSPIIGLYGLLFVPLQTKTLWWSVFLYWFSIIGSTAGSHRLYSHRSFKASTPLQIFLLIGGTCGVQGSAFWWAREHRAHHRYTDSDLDPHSGKEGFWWTHAGWILFRRDIQAGPTDVSDLKKNKLVMFQHRHYFKLFPFLAYVMPAAVAGYFWGDWAGGICYAAMLRLTIVQHSIMCINSLAHTFGDAPFDDKHTPRNHFFTAIVTAGEGYHNFHHQFPVDYRNGIKWYQYDPTKWFIYLSSRLGLSTQLQTFPQNEISKGELTMTLRRLKEKQEDIKWPARPDKLPLVSWETFQREAKKNSLILINGYIHDASEFENKHPGGKAIIRARVGKDATAAFGGGVYEHSNAAHNLLAMMRVAVLEGGVEHVKYVTPAERLRIIEHYKEEEESH